MRKVLMLIPVALVLALLIGVEAYGAESHQSTAMVVKVDPAKRTVILWETGHSHELVLAQSALLRDDHGMGLKGLKALQVGDYVYEDCILGKDGRSSIAREIRVLRPAWRMIESPEY